METKESERRVLREHDRKGRPSDSIPLSRQTIGKLVRDADRLAALERAVIVREDVEAMGYEVPEWAIAWRKGNPPWYNVEWLGDYRNEDAPDLRPDQDGPLTLPVISLREGEG